MIRRGLQLNHQKVTHGSDLVPEANKPLLRGHLRDGREKRSRLDGCCEGTVTAPDRRVTQWSQVSYAVRKGPRGPYFLKMHTKLFSGKCPVFSLDTKQEAARMAKC